MSEGEISSPAGDTDYAIDIFEDLAALVLSLSAIWSIGKFGGLFGLPPMCGELVGGVILGPQVS